MKLVIDANAAVSALVADSKTRELVVTLEPDLLFQYIQVVPVDEFHRAIEEADAAIGDTDPDFDERDVVERYSTSDVLHSFDTR